MLIALALPSDIFDSQSKHFIFLVGAVGIWRYSMGATHFIRGMVFLYGVYPTCAARYASWAKLPTRPTCT